MDTVDNKKKLTIYATGHRPKDLPGGYELTSDDNRKLARLLRHALEGLLKKGYDIEVVSGMALGVDQLFFLAGVNLRKKYPGRVAVHSVIPSVGQADYWIKSSQDYWAHLRTLADKETIVHDGEYAPWIMMARNKVMADISDLCISVWNGNNHGGTFQSTKYSVKKGQKVLRIDPMTNTYKGLLTMESFEELIK